MNKLPVEPTVLTAHLPGITGRLGDAPEDFLVDELPLVAPSGQGEHLWVRIRKRGMTTGEAIQAVARAARVPDRQIGSAGMKDKHAVTSQWLSVPARVKPVAEWTLGAGLEVLEQARHATKLHTGMLLGNRFQLRLVDAGAEDEARTLAICGHILKEGLPNFFGGQRFSKGGGNLAAALGWLEEGAPDLGRRTRLLRKLYPSVVQSEIFNRYLVRRLAMGLEKLLPGEVVRLAGSRSVFVVEDPDREQARLQTRDIHPTGPLLGPKMKAPSGAPADLERAVVADLGLSGAALETLGRLVDGTRRDLLVWPEQLQLTAAESGVLELSFVLPAGSYATQLLRELTRTSWLAGPSAPCPEVPAPPG